MCRDENKRRTHVANGPRIKSELSNKGMSINRLAKEASIDRNTIRGMLNSQSKFRSSFQRVAKVLYNNADDWMRLTSGSSCIIVTFDFGCDLPENTTTEEAIEFIKMNPSRFADWFAKMRDLTDKDPQIADVAFACIRVRLIATVQDGKSLLEAFRRGEFDRFDVVDVFIEQKPKGRRWPMPPWLVFIGLLGISFLVAMFLGVAAYMGSSGEIMVAGAGRPEIWQNEPPGKRRAEIAFSI